MPTKQGLHGLAVVVVSSVPVPSLRRRPRACLYLQAQPTLPRSRAERSRGIAAGFSEFWASVRVRWDVLDGSTDAIEEGSADLVDWLVG